MQVWDDYANFALQAVVEVAEAATTSQDLALWAPFALWLGGAKVQVRGECGCALNTISNKAQVARACHFLILQHTLQRVPSPYESIPTWRLVHRAGAHMAGHTSCLQSPSNSDMQHLSAIPAALMLEHTTHTICGKMPLQGPRLPPVSLHTNRLFKLLPASARSKLRSPCFPGPARTLPFSSHLPAA